MPVEPVVWNEWYPVAIVDDLIPGKRYATTLLDHEIEYVCAADGTLSAWRAQDSSVACRTQMRYHTHWVSLGEPADSFFNLPEFEESDRRVVGSGSMAVHASGLRVIENFLDMAHFPFVHKGYLGDEPYTDVEEYTVTTEPNGELFARDCRFFQPRGAAAAPGGIDTEYVYRVARPYAAFLYKSNPMHPDRMDAIGLFVQPVTQEYCVAHTILVYVDDTTSDYGLRLFQQTIFGQDLMILSNEVPRRLPVDPGFEMAVRADAMSIAYRRLLRERGIHYGTYDSRVARAGSPVAAVGGL